MPLQARASAISQIELTIRSFRILTLLLFMLHAFSAWAQDMKVRSLTIAKNDMSASIERRPDRNGTPCGLVKVQLPLPGATFDQTGMVVGSVDYKSGEYWVYMNDGAYMLEIRHPNFHPLFINFNDYGITVQKLVTYKLVIDVPHTDIPMQKFIVDYSPANAIVIVDSKSYQGNGHLELTLPVGSHDYQIAAVAMEQPKVPLSSMNCLLAPFMKRLSAPRRHPGRHRQSQEAATFLPQRPPVPLLEASRPLPLTG